MISFGYDSGFQLVLTRVLYRESYSQPMFSCLVLRHISHISLLTSGQFNEKYISNITNRQTELDFLDSNNIESQKCFVKKNFS